MKGKVYCRFDFLRHVTEQTMQNADGSFKTLSITNGKEYEMMIFLGRKNKKSNYFVQVFKVEPKNIFVRYFRDKFIKYEIGPLYDVFFFGELEEAKEFIQNIFSHHPEYEKRPLIVE